MVSLFGKQLWPRLWFRRLKYSVGKHEKEAWAALIIFFVVLAIGYFAYYRYIPVNQSFGPTPLSGLGGQNPVQVTLSLTCNSDDGSYISETSSVACHISAKAVNYVSNYLNLTARIVSLNDTARVTCTSTIYGVNANSWHSAACRISSKDDSFELPAGNYKVVVFRFDQGGAVVTTAIPVAFRGELHVMTAFERQLRISEDGTAWATFLAFLFLIPATLLQVRSLVRRRES